MIAHEYVSVSRESYTSEKMPCSHYWNRDVSLPHSIVSQYTGSLRHDVQWILMSSKKCASFDTSLASMARGPMFGHVRSREGSDTEQTLNLYCARRKDPLNPKPLHPRMTLHKNHPTRYVCRGGARDRDSI